MADCKLGSDCVVRTDQQGRVIQEVGEPSRPPRVVRRPLGGSFQFKDGFERTGAQLLEHRALANKKITKTDVRDAFLLTLNGRYGRSGTTVYEVEALRRRMKQLDQDWGGPYPVDPKAQFLFNDLVIQFRNEDALWSAAQIRYLHDRLTNLYMRKNSGGFG